MDATRTEVKRTDAIRTVDDLGRIIIPKSVRDYLSIDKGDKFEMVIQNGNMVLVRHMPTCSICDYDDNVQKLGRAYLCEECREKFDVA